MCGGGCGSARTMRAQREVQLAPRNSYDISAAPQILFIKMAAALSAAGGLLIRFIRHMLLLRSCNFEVR